VKKPTRSIYTRSHIDLYSRMTKGKQLTGPVKELTARSTCARLRSQPSSAGILPVMELLPRTRVWVGSEGRINVESVWKIKTSAYEGTMRVESLPWDFWTGRYSLESILRINVRSDQLGGRLLEGRVPLCDWQCTIVPRAEIDLTRDWIPSGNDSLQTALEWR